VEGSFVVLREVCWVEVWVWGFCFEESMKRGGPVCWEGGSLEVWGGILKPEGSGNKDGVTGPWVLVRQGWLP